MKKIFGIIDEVAGYLIAMTCILFILITSIQFHCFNKTFYRSEYQTLQTAQTLGMTESDLFVATETLLDYLQDTTDSLDVEITIQGTQTKAFNSKEIAHMKDVRNLYQFALTLRIISVVVFIISFVYLLFRKKRDIWTLCSINYMKTAVIFAVVVIMLAIWAYVDFDAFWTAFHKVAFRNDLCLLNPNTDLMINLFPSTFFSHLVFRIVGTFVFSFGFLFVISYYYLHRQLKKYHEGHIV